MDELWRLISGEADAIQRFSGFLQNDIALSPDSEALAETIQRIIDAKRDNVEALKYLYDALTKEKPATDMTQYAKQALSNQREKAKLIK